jgi:hypothetical protein
MAIPTYLGGRSLPSYRHDLLETSLFAAPKRKRISALVCAAVAAMTLTAGLVNSSLTANAANCENVSTAGVEGAQSKLMGSGFWLDAVDGIWGPNTQQAIYAFQKYQGMARTGCADAATVQAISSFNEPLTTPAGAPVTGATVDQTRQLLFVTDGGAVEWVFNTSTGDQVPWMEGSYSGTSITPNGEFTINRAIDAMHSSTLGLGSMYRPRYFATGGYAVHGSSSVPPYAASHGCVRVSNDAMDFIWAQNLLPMGANLNVSGSPA